MRVDESVLKGAPKIFLSREKTAYSTSAKHPKTLVLDLCFCRESTS